MNTNFNESGVKETVSDRLCDSAEIRSLFGGRSNMWVWRRVKDGTLPKPIEISGRNYWRFAKIKAIIAELASIHEAA